MNTLKYTNLLRKNYLRAMRLLCSGNTIDTNKVSWNVRYPDDYVHDYANVSGDEFSLILQKRIEKQEPTLVTRFGSDIMMCTLAALNKPTLLNRLKYITDQRDTIGLQPWVVQPMTNNAGFFAEKDELLERDLYRYGELINSIIPEIDILATVLRQERLYAKYFDHIVRCYLIDIEPYRLHNPWTKALRGKKVLVVHPFERTIRYQYENHRKELFATPDLLPEFELKTIRAVQSIAGNRPVEHKDWFAALHYMEHQIDEIGDFDVALIGCGAYGMPLGAYVKRLGKVAVHMGGGVQFLFGIKNKRADEDEDSTVRDLYNDAWIRPFPEDTPSGIEKVEGGCYW